MADNGQQRFRNAETQVLLILKINDYENRK